MMDQQTLRLLPLPWREGWGEGLRASNQLHSPSPGTSCRPLQSRTFTVSGKRSSLGEVNTLHLRDSEERLS
jgi:hypothetical protein